MRMGGIAAWRRRLSWE